MSLVTHADYQEATPWKSLSEMRVVDGGFRDWIDETYDSSTTASDSG